MKPLCFVLMPFGRKRDERGREVDFDSIYRTVIARAVVSAEMEPIRADEEQVGGSIHKPMYERLMLCEYAIADVTSANPNVYYELGIRHALRPRSTVILFAAGTVLPFDVLPLRGMPYLITGAGVPAQAEEDSRTAAARAGWELETTARQLDNICKSRIARRDYVSWVRDVAAKFREIAARPAPKPH